MIKGEDTHKQFASVIIYLAEMSAKLEDQFFIKKLNNNLINLISSYTAFGFWHGDNVAQYYSVKSALARDLDNTLELLDYLEHLNHIDPYPILLSRHLILKIKTHFLANKLETKSEITAKQKREQSPKTKTRPNEHTSGRKITESELSKNQEMIFNFVKSAPQVRTKEITDKITVLSQRTVKRNLKELVECGLLTKKTINKAVHYRAVKSADIAKNKPI